MFGQVIPKAAWLSRATAVDSDAERREGSHQQSAVSTYLQERVEIGQLDLRVAAKPLVKTQTS